MTSSLPAILFHLILFFDVNKTIVALDSSKGEGLEATLTRLYAEECVAVWEEGAPEMSFYDYVRWKIPAPKSDQAAKRRRQELVQTFWQRVQGHPDAAKLHTRYENLKKKLGQSDGLTFFPSFLRVLDEVDSLRERGVRCQIVFRTFGEDLPEVLRTLEALRPDFPIAAQGHFEASTLVLNEQRYEDWDAIWLAIKEAPGHLAIRDDWQTWNRHGERAAYGKPFVIDPQDSDCLALFFDDNLFEEDNPDLDIVHAVTRSGADVPLVELRDQCLHQVKPLEAAEDRDYFRRKIFQSLRKSALTATTAVRETAQERTRTSTPCGTRT